MEGPCSLCTDELVVQACSCCPRGFCQKHAVLEAMHESAPVTTTSTGAQLFVCEFCQANAQCVGASLVHRHLLAAAYTTQDLYTASGSHVSLYRPGSYPACSPKDFSTQCFEWDLTQFKEQVGLTGDCSAPLTDCHTIPVAHRAETAHGGCKQVCTQGQCIGLSQAGSLATNPK